MNDLHIKNKGNYLGSLPFGTFFSHKDLSAKALAQAGTKPQSLPAFVGHSPLRWAEARLARRERTKALCNLGVLVSSWQESQAEWQAT